MPVFLIRHGQSEFNAAYQGEDSDPMLYDAPLTDKGRQQAEAARALVVDLGIKQVITSPLTRAIQTALCLFDGIAPITVAAGHRELLIHSCDVGRHPADLQRDFPALSFSHLADCWWHFSYGDRLWAEVTGRTQAFFAPIDYDSKDRVILPQENTTDIF